MNVRNYRKYSQEIKLEAFELVHLTNRKTPFHEILFVSIRIIKERMSLETSYPQRSSHVDDELNGFEFFDTIPLPTDPPEL